MHTRIRIPLKIRMPELLSKLEEKLELLGFLYDETERRKRRKVA